MLALLVAAAALQIYRVQIDTTKGPIVVEVHRDWAPQGADRFYELVTSGYFDDTRFFRVVKGQGRSSGSTAIRPGRSRGASGRFPTIRRPATRWSAAAVAFAFAVPGGRTTQVYISLRDNSYQDAQGFVPFGRVVSGMDVADALNDEYGESSGGGIRAGHQQPLFDGGNAYLDRAFPRLDRIIRARVLP